MLIDRDKLLRLAKSERETCGKDYDFYGLLSDIENAPSVNAVPVIHGKWVIMGGMEPPEYHHHHQCSVCKSYAPMRPPYGGREEFSPWCPACGAKMDLEEQDAAD